MEQVFRGEVYYIDDSGITLTGNEQKGRRPAVIVSNDIGNKHAPIVEVVYLTTRNKKSLPTHVEVYSTERLSIALCEQIETVSKERLERYVGQLSDNEMRQVDKALAISIGIGLTIKTNRLVEKWGNAYAVEGLKQDSTVDVEKINMSGLAEDGSITEELIKLKAQRDVYKELYMDLLKGERIEKQ